MTNYNNPLDDELRVDQLFCLSNLYNDPQTSFHLKMWCLFQRNVLYNNIVYSELIGDVKIIIPLRSSNLSCGNLCMEEHLMTY
jgi:hypothetical protein